MTKNIYFIDGSPAWQPIRDKSGGVRVFSPDGARAFVRRHLPRYGTLATVGHGDAPLGSLERIGERILSISSDTNDGDATGWPWAEERREITSH